MSQNQKDKLEELKELSQEVRDCEKSLADDKWALANAERWVKISEFNLGCALKRLKTFNEEILGVTTQDEEDLVNAEQKEAQDKTKYQDENNH